MNNHVSNLSIEAKIRQVVQTLEPGQEFSDTLLQQIMEQPPAARPEPRRFQRLFSRPLWNGAVLVGMLLSAFLLVGPSRVYAAIQSLLVYIPGVGFVENGDGTQYLTQPISIQQNGVSLTVDQVVADAQHTIVSYHFDNLPQTPGSEGSLCFYDDNKIRLPDGKLQPPIGGGVNGSQAQIEYPPLPSGVNRLTLLAAMNIQDPQCTAPSNWSVDIPLGPMPPQVTLMPVYEGPAVVSDTTRQETALPAQKPNTADIQFSIDRVAVLEDGTLVTGHALWNSKDWEYVSVFPELESVHINDADGKDVPFEPADEICGDNCFAYKIKGKNFRSPLVLKVDSVAVNGLPAGTIGFSLDAGQNPQTGQSWNLNQDLDVLGQKINIQTVKVVQIDDSASAKKMSGFAFEVKTDPNVYGVDFRYNGPQKMSQSFSQSKKLADNMLLLEIAYPEGLPNNTVSFQVGSIFYRLNGSWQVEWQIPSAPQP